MVLPFEQAAMIGVLFGALVGSGAYQMIPRKHIPLAEIYLKKGPVVWFIDANNEWIPYTVKKTRLGYFAIFTDRVKGVFHIDPRKKFYMGKTPCYAISLKEMNNYDPVDIGMVNRFLEQNGIFKLRRRDMKHLEKLRQFKIKFGKKANEKMDEGMIKEKEKYDEAIKTGLAAGEKRIADLNESENTNYVLDDQTRAVWLVDYMLRQSLISEKEAETFLFKIENNILEVSGVIEELRKLPDVAVTSVIDTDIQRIVEDFGSQNPLEITGLVDDFRDARKGLKTLTPTPVKSFIPGGTVLAIGLVVIFFVILVSNGTISGDLLGNMKLPGLP